MTTQRLINIINLTVSAHPERVRLLFQKYGIAAPVTAQNVFDGMIVKGKPFARDFAQIVAHGSRSFVGVNADGATTPAAATTDSGFSSDDFSKWIKNITEGAQAGAGLYTLFSGLFNKDEKTTGDPNAQTDLALLMQQENAANAAKTQRLIIYAVAGLAVFVVIAAFILKRK